jgi:hypothetical protein
MIQIKLTLPDRVHKVIEQTISPLAKARTVSGENVSINVWLPNSVNDLVVGICSKYGLSKADLIQSLLRAFCSIAEGGLTKAETAALTEAATMITEQTRPYEKRYKIGLTKATLIPAILHRIFETSNVDEFAINLQNRKTQKV